MSSFFSSSDDASSRRGNAASSSSSSSSSTRGHKRKFLEMQIGASISKDDSTDIMIQWARYGVRAFVSSEKASLLPQSSSSQNASSPNLSASNESSNTDIAPTTGSNGSDSGSVNIANDSPPNASVSAVKHKLPVCLPGYYLTAVNSAFSLNNHPRPNKRPRRLKKQLIQLVEDNGTVTTTSSSELTTRPTAMNNLETRHLVHDIGSVTDMQQQNQQQSNDTDSIMTDEPQNQQHFQRQLSSKESSDWSVSKSSDESLPKSHSNSRQFSKKEPIETAWDFFEEFPPHVRLHILEWVPIPDFEFEPNILKKMEKSRSQFVFSTTNHVFYKYKSLMRYMYGYFSSDATRHIYLIFPSVRIGCTQEVYDYTHLGVALPKFPNLTRICLTRMLLKKEDVPYLPSSLASITMVAAQQVDWTVIDLILDHLSNLYYLYLQTKNVPLNDQTEPLLKRICRLTHVGFINSKVTDDVARIFCDSAGGYTNNIQELILNGNRITAKGLEPLCNNSTLKTLRVSKNNITEQGAAYIKQCVSLEEVSVDHCDINGRAMGHLFDLPRLKRLWCRQNHICSGFANVAKHENLAILNLHDNTTEIDVPMMSALSRCRSLHTLVMNKCKLKDEHIEALLDKNLTLRRLYINWNEHLTMRSIKVIAKNTSLYKLAYSQHRLDDDQLIYLLSHNRTIEVLNVPFVKGISDKFLITLQQCSHLKTLKIRETPVTEQGLQFIMDHCLSVTQLSYGQVKEERWIRPGTDLLKIVD